MTTVNTDDNPMIMCTQRELAWSTWQISRGRIAWDLSPPPAAGSSDRWYGWTPILDDTKEELARFEAWWTWAAGPAQVVHGALGTNWTLRDLMESAWDKAREHRSFGNYWATIVAAQPKIG
jgi:hypothetical protein